MVSIWIIYESMDNLWIIYGKWPFRMDFPIENGDLVPIDEEVIQIITNLRNAAETSSNHPGFTLQSGSF